MVILQNEPALNIAKNCLEIFNNRPTLITLKQSINPDKCRK